MKIRSSAARRATIIFFLVLYRCAILNQIRKVELARQRVFLYRHTMLN